MNKGISLHIGINELSSAYRISTPLIGPEDDARAMQNIADRNGFASTLLLGPTATRQRVIDEMTAASESLWEGDIMLVTASCHGSVRENPIDEPSGFDANWCLFDAPIWDDEIGRLLNCFREGVSIVVISDSCNAGSVISEVRLDDPSIGFGSAIKSISPDVAKRAYDDYMKEQGPPPIGCDKEERKAFVLLISASGDHGTAEDFAYDAGSIRGRYSRFTRALLDVWGDGTFAGNYALLFDGVKKILSHPEHRPGPMAPQFLMDPENSEDHWHAMIPFTPGRRFQPNAASGLADVTSVLTVDAVVTIDDQCLKANGAVVFVMDHDRKIRPFRFIYTEGRAIFDLEPGIYTLYGMIPYHVERIPGEDYSLATPFAKYSIMPFEMPAGDLNLELDLGPRGDKGDIRAVVKVDGQGRKGDTVTVEPGGFQELTDSFGVARFPGLAPGTYTVTAQAVKACEGTPKLGAPPPQTAQVSTTGSVNLAFDITVCPD